MRREPFGSYRAAVPVIGQGTWYIEHGSRAAAVAALRRGLDLGMTHVDTAEMYGSGQAEEIVGEAIAGGDVRVQEELRVPEHGGERSADLMAHVGEERALAGVRRVGATCSRDRDEARGGELVRAHGEHVGLLEALVDVGSLLATEDEEERRVRLDTARVELAAAEEFDATVVNDDVRRAAAELVSLMGSPVPEAKRD